ncbi:MAG: hypothetical protein RLZZ611_1822 [Cyanobacteriota bacterium]|jgi:hypothetical protein
MGRCLWRCDAVDVPAISLAMIRTSERRNGMAIGLAAPLLLLGLSLPPAHALPFDPLPSAFQRWLNARRDWPDNAHRVFDKLAECSDQTAAKSPYRMAVFTCLEGTLTIHRPGGSARTCAIQRVSYFPTNQRVRVWAGNCS